MRDILVALSIALSLIVGVLVAFGVVAGVFWAASRLAPWGPLAVGGLVVVATMTYWAYVDRRG